MIEIKDKVQCSGCFACVNGCPKGCIKMVEDFEGFKYPKVDKNSCIECKKCIKVCPIKNSLDVESKKICIGAKNKNDEERGKSSSGGVFLKLCEYIIEKKGVVFGVAFEEDLNLKHSKAETIEECKKFRGSKYLQSDVGNTFKEAKEELEKGRYVLFSGTSCQIKGLKLFLNKEYENLLAVDVICHGVPSKKVFKIYKEYEEKKEESKLVGIEFRDKTIGWRRFSVKKKFENKEMYEENIENKFMKGFLNNLYLRPSCYECKAKNFTSGSDISLADFWGIDKIDSDFFDDLGVSLIIINSKNGENIFKKIENNFHIKGANLEEVAKYNPCIIKAVDKNRKREIFFREINKGESFEAALFKGCKVTFLDKVRNKIKYEMSKI